MPFTNPYKTKLETEFSNYAFENTRAQTFKCSWRKHVFNVQKNKPLDLEIGTGNGFYFAHYALQNPNRLLVGIEIKYKPLIQAIGRARRRGSKNMRCVHGDAQHINHLFGKEELNNVFIHHPDPWEKRRQKKHRLLTTDFLNILFTRQKNNQFVEIKTDSRDYFQWLLNQAKKTKYNIKEMTTNLHHSPWKNENFVTHFESIFIKKNQPIYRLKLHKRIGPVY